MYGDDDDLVTWISERDRKSRIVNRPNLFDCLCEREKFPFGLVNPVECEMFRIPGMGLFYFVGEFETWDLSSFSGRNIEKS